MPWSRRMLARREGDKVRGRRAIIIRDRRGLEITAGGAEAVARFDDAIAAYLAFRADVGARLEAALEADRDMPLALVTPPPTAPARTWPQVARVPPGGRLLPPSRSGAA